MASAAVKNPAIEIGHIPTVSPSFSELLRACMLRAGLSSSAVASNYVLGNPKAWLGSAYHEVLAIATQTRLESLNDAVAIVWDRAVAKQRARAAGHPLDVRFGAPDKWPGYHFTAAMAAERAKQICTGPAEAEGREKSETSRLHQLEMSERRFTSHDGQLVGRPDLVRNGIVIDFKTGSVFEEGEPEQVKASYLRQLRLYGFLVHETLGWWPERGMLLPMNSAPVDVKLEPHECEAEAQVAIDLLDRYNKVLLTEDAPKQMASPSPEACRWCPFQAICPAFWDVVSPEWSSDLKSVVLAGELVGELRHLHTGAFGMVVKVAVGTQVPSTLEVAPLDPRVCGNLHDASSGTGVRATGLTTRLDGSVAPTRRIIIMKEADIPGNCC